MFRVSIRNLVLATIFSMMTLFTTNSSQAGWWWHHCWSGYGYGYPQMTMYDPVYTPIIGWDWCYDPCDACDFDLSGLVGDGCDTWTADACCEGLAYSSVMDEPATESPAPPAPAVAKPAPAVPKHADSVLQNKPVVPPPPTDDAPKPPAVPPPPTPVESSPEPTPAAPAKEPASKVTHAPADGTLLTVHVPTDAKVYINGQLTKTPGAHRQYVSRGLLPGYGYGYEVRAVIERNGRQLTDTQVVHVHAGEAAQVALRFDRGSAVQTTVTLHVPENATVTLAGNKTRATGTVRRFTTTELPQGTRWQDYRIEVASQRDGQWVTREKTITLTGGDSVTLDFDVDGDRVAQR